MNPETIPYGYCQCGCGEKTSIAYNANRTYGHVVGEPVRYRVGHSGRKPVVIRERLCACGCGQTTTIIRTSDKPRGLERGVGNRFIKGHARRIGARIRPSDYELEDRGFRTPCWIWQLYLCPKGYAIANRLGKTKAYRIAYEQFREEIPKGLTIDHLCRQPSCVNPWHMEVVTMSENAKRVWLDRQIAPVRLVLPSHVEPARGL